MRYKNIKTGAIVDSPFIVAGSDWEAMPGENPETKDLSHPELLQLVKEKDQKIEELLAKIDELEDSPDAKEDSTETHDDDEYVEEEVDLKDLTNDQLETLAKDEGIELTSKDKRNKDALIAAILAGLE